MRLQVSSASSQLCPRFMPTPVQEEQDAELKYLQDNSTAFDDQEALAEQEEPQSQEVCLILSTTGHSRLTVQRSKDACMMTMLPVHVRGLVPGLQAQGPDQEGAEEPSSSARRSGLLSQALQAEQPAQPAASEEEPEEAAESQGTGPRGNTVVNTPAMTPAQEPPSHRKSSLTLQNRHAAWHGANRTGHAGRGV